MRAAGLVIAAVLFGGLVVEAPAVPGGAPTIVAESADGARGGAGSARDRQRSAGRGGIAERVIPPTPAFAAVSEVRADRRPTVPAPGAIRAARRYVRERDGLVSYAFRDSDGGLHGRDDDRSYASASVVKVMLLAAEIHRLQREQSPIDPATDELLTAMITSSDNAAADVIYARVGDSGLVEIAEQARMERFTVGGYWGNAQITAADMARLFGDLDRVLGGPDSEYALGLLGAITPEQSWGVPEVAGDGWAVRFKGGWLPDRALVHQAAELRERDGSRELSLAILTDSQPSFEYGIETVEGVAARLLSR